jgi:hypothetical protein
VVLGELSPKQRATLTFWFRVVLLFTASLLPAPWVADGYTTLFAAATNGALAIVNGNPWVHFHLEAPAAIRVAGSWKAPLVITDPDARAIGQILINVRTFSYIPMATFLALALASPLRGWRRNAHVVGGGVAAMAVFTTLFAALPIIARYAAVGAFGTTAAAVVDTSYQALATPVMVYFVPLLVWWLLMWLTSPADELPSLHAS